MPVYGVSLAEWADSLRIYHPRGRRDWSMDVVFHIGMAHAALQELQAKGISTSEGNRRLVEEALESAWREILFIRLRNIPPEQLLEDVPRTVRLTRTGQLINGTDQTAIPAYQRGSCNTHSQPKGNTVPKSRSSNSRRGRSRTG